MITYFDTSSLLKLLIEEEGSDWAAQAWMGADVVASASLVLVEARAALAAASRADRLTGRQHRDAKSALLLLIDDLAVVEVTVDLIAQAADLAEEEALRSYDAVHLGAALTVDAAVMASADLALCAAAEGRGLHIANPVES